MALDEPNDNDEKFEVSDFTFLVEKQLLDEAKSITVDYIITPQGEGFIINSGMKKASDCGGCTSC
jgi:Fe-S cluster assembly iron-binding protein IscA